MPTTPPSATDVTPLPSNPTDSSRKSPIKTRWRKIEAKIKGIAARLSSCWKRKPRTNADVPLVAKQPEARQDSAMEATVNGNGNGDVIAVPQRRLSRSVSNRAAATADEEEAEVKRRTLVLPESEEDLIIKMLNWADLDKPPPIVGLTPPAD